MKEKTFISFERQWNFQKRIGLWYIKSQNSMASLYLHLSFCLPLSFCLSLPLSLSLSLSLSSPSQPFYCLLLFNLFWHFRPSDQAFNKCPLQVEILWSFSCYWRKYSIWSTGNSWKAINKFSSGKWRLKRLTQDLRTLQYLLKQEFCRSYLQQLNITYKTVVDSIPY